MKKTLLFLFLVTGFISIPQSIFSEDKDIQSGSIAMQAFHILESRCFSCHGGSNNLGELLLDSHETALKGGEKGKAIIPGEPDKSLIIQAVKGENPDLPIMPMEGDPLTEDQINILVKWIKNGAAYPQSEPIQKKGKDHWAYNKPVKPNVPQVKNQDWIQNPIDNFILAKLEEKQLAPQTKASPEKLIRRVSLDTTGLVPPPNEVETLIENFSEDSYKQYIERMFDRPQYGEHMGRYWLDLARYADTNGYQVDKTRRISLYRDWVIDAFNKNMPFDQFTIEQLAGDLLPNPSSQQLVATGFHRNTQTNEEGGVKDEEYRRRAIVNRVDTTATVWLGTTMACAECHDHKYDPFTQEEFYQFYAFFNQTVDKGNSFVRNTPYVTVPKQVEQEAIDSVNSFIEMANADIKTVERNIAPELNEWEQKWHDEKPTSWIALDPVLPDAARGEKPVFRRDQTFELPEVDKNGMMSVYVESPKMHVEAVRIEFLPNENQPSNPDTILISEIDLVTAVRKSESEDIPIQIQNIHATYEPKNQSVKTVTDDNIDTGWGLGDKNNEAHSIIFELKTGQRSFLNGPLVLLKIKRPDDGFQPTVRVSITEHKPEKRHPIVPNDIVSILETQKVKRTENQNTALQEYYFSISPTLKAFRELKDSLSKRKDELEYNARSSIVMEELQNNMRDTNVHIRGNYLTPGKQVYAAVPAVLHSFPEDAPKNRLTFAKWIMDQENPLTARVVVNRLWQQVFGIGIVDTSEDFGTRASAPSHPELLDWLAVEFMESNWDIQHIMRLILTSAVYMQSEKATPHKIEIDPKNRYLSRGSRFRLDAELIRDNALEAAGILNKEIGGESVFPPHPLGIWKEIGFLRPYFGMSRWPESFGEDRYRRGMYTFWRRTIPYPTFAAFDAPSREICTIKRPRTNTPLQALLTLNDPAFFEAAQALAARLLQEGTSTEHRIKLAYLLCLSRPPKQLEMKRFYLFVLQQQKQYANNPDDAITMFDRSPVLDVLEFIPEDKVEWAAWTIAANVILNLDEFITKG